MVKEKITEVKHEVASFADEVSPTAASAFNPIHPVSGAMVYRCALRDGTHIDVEAVSGDEAALKALAKRPGAFVTGINPAPQAR